MDPPRLETARLVLRPWQPADLEAYMTVTADPEVMRYLGGSLGRQQSWRQLALFAGHWTLRGYGIWAVERKEDGVLVGRAGLWNPEGWFGLEVGWTLARAAWGNGYATEAGRAAMDWAWTALDAPDLISVIHVDNVASQRVADRLRLRWVRDDTLNDQPVLIYGTERPATA